MSSIKLNFAKRRVLAIEETVDEVEVASRQAAFASDVEDLVSEVIGAIDDLKRAVADFSGRFRFSSNTPSDALICASQYGALLERSIKLLPRVRTLSDAVVQNNGHGVKDASDLLILEHELQRIFSDFSKQWRLPDKQRIAASKRAIAEGRCRVL